MSRTTENLIYNHQFRTTAKRAAPLLRPQWCAPGSRLGCDDRLLPINWVGSCAARCQGAHQTLTFILQRAKLSDRLISTSALQTISDDEWRIVQAEYRVQLNVALARHCSLEFHLLALNLSSMLQFSTYSNQRRKSVVGRSNHRSLTYTTNI